MTGRDGSRRNTARRRPFVWAARLGLLGAGLCVGLLLIVLLDPLLPGIDWVPAVPSEEFHHVRVPGVWVAQQWEWGPTRVHIGSAGWREAPPAAAGEASPPAGDRFRLAVMGDSFVEAVQVAWEDTFVARLEVRSDGRTEVLNRGISGYGPLLSLLRWRRQVVHERPTHLLLLVCPNDIVDDRTYTDNARRPDGSGTGGVSSAEAGDTADLRWKEPRSRTVPREGWLPRLYRRWHGRAAVVWVSLKTRAVADPDEPLRNWRRQNRAMTSLTGRHLLELAAAAREAGVEFTLSAVPTSWEFREQAPPPELRVGPTFADNVAAWAEANGVRYVDLQPAFRTAAAEGQRLFFERDGHFTEAGHAVAAEVFAAAWPELFAAGEAPRDAVARPLSAPREQVVGNDGEEADHGRGR